jgi:hypothetical protein
MENLTASQRLRKILSYREPEYPKVGEPLGGDGMRSKTERQTVYQPHIIMDRTNGKFINLGFDSESAALEYSAEIVLESRINGALLGKF